MFLEFRKKRLLEEAQAKLNQAKSKGDTSGMETIKKSLAELEKEVKQIDQKVDGIKKEERVKMEIVTDLTCNNERFLAPSWPRGTWIPFLKKASARPLSTISPRGWSRK